jgi:glycosyltransferase involved in cell wall biosynthesis
MAVNVLYLVRTWALGGAHTIIRTCLQRLPKRYNVICAAYDAGPGDDAFVDMAQDAGAQVAEKRIPWRSRTNWFKARRALREMIDAYDIDLVHTHDPHSNVLAGLGRRRWPCACVASAYGWWDRFFPLRSQLYMWLEKRMALPQFDQIYTVSYHMKDKIMQGPVKESRVNVVHTGLDPAFFEQGAPREQVRDELGIPGDACVVGTVSRLYPEKGHIYLLRALSRIAADLPDVRLLVVGSGPLLEPLQHEADKLGIADRVRFTGFYRDLPGALRAMDIFTLPSILDEGFPTVSLEAQWARLPVVASDTGGTSETLDVPETGILVPPKNVRLLAGAIEELAADPQRRRAMGEAGRAWVSSQFTLEDMMDRLTDFYDRALAAYEAARK